MTTIVINLICIQKQETPVAKFSLPYVGHVQTTSARGGFGQKSDNRKGDYADFVLTRRGRRGSKIPIIMQTSFVQGFYMVVQLLR